ncbi:hypothetical protein [Pseudobacteroides cellulosolvens]|uniref:Ig-like domain-containing protein n=1 Tax=Pseudobacteroides cellulosolvens ATCC 35603 = DSM 2933 TaxID=398512 RepID=A0A0L6JMF5_9FIRM|nr:hypothetical protein [Pseudobacteroides cellulosolvens]KNY26954.1 hypothetical protein Bccel_2219 [Pseudobacteroides cellulosolvens ATCC 35603 = DSM 2933]
METGNNPEIETKRNEACNETFQQVKKGNRSYREGFIGEHETFVLGVVCEYIGDNTIKKNSEEFHVGLFAFIYSIDKFTQGSYEEFIEFAQGVIKKWLDDYRVKNLKSFRDDVAHLKHKLWEFGITIPQLISSTPKDNLSIKSALKAANEILNTESLFINLKIDKNLSVEELASLNATVARKVKNNRKYTIALILILKSNLDVLKNYLKNIEADDIIADSIGTVIERTKDTAIYMTGYGRFNMTNSFGNVVDLGKMVYFTKSNLRSGSKVPAFKYSFAAAGIILVAVVAFTGFKFISDGVDNGTKPSVVSVADKEKEAFSESDDKKDNEKSDMKTEDQKDSESKDTGANSSSDEPSAIPQSTPDEDITANPTPVQNSNVPVITPIPEVNVKPTPLATGSAVTKPVPTVKNALVPTKEPVKAKPTSPKPFTTPKVIKPSVKPTAVPSTKPATKPADKPTNKPVSVGYATTKATGVPGSVQIVSDSSEVSVGGSYTIHMKIAGGNNATSWKLYENGRVVFTRNSHDNSPGEQDIPRMIIAKKAGTYTYKCEATNSYGTTASSTITVTIK